MRRGRDADQGGQVEAAGVSGGKNLCRDKRLSREAPKRGEEIKR